MGLNATLIGQMITFAVLVFFTMKFVWPPIIQAMQARQQKIADGLAAAERGKHEMELAQHKAADLLRAAKVQAAGIVEAADKRAAAILEQAKDQARVEGKRIIEMASADIEQQKQHARDSLSAEIAGIALRGAEKIIGAKLDESANNALIDQLIAEVSGE